MDISSKRNSRGFLALRHQVEKLGEEAYEKHGCNFVAILVDEPELNRESRLNKPSMIYKTLGVSGRTYSELFAVNLKLSLNPLISERCEHRASRGKVLSRGHGDGNLSRDPDQYFGNQSSDYLDQDFSPRNRAPGSYIRRPYYINAKKAIVNEANKAGVDIHWGKLPWKRLPNICAKFGVYINNYPDGLASPFESVDVPFHLGLAGLSDDEHKTLIHALRREKMYPMHFLRVEDERVLIYAPPPPDSPRSRSKRIFLDGTYDYKGHRQVEVIRDLDNEIYERQPQKRRPGRPRKIINQNIQELESLNSVQHSVSKRRLNEFYADRPEKRIRFFE
ncbi:hypothetical protein M378DRAFT_177841 [Amanita muscaria Koide BX008]|uniref:Uncharacterized protein n=1 Tax=Amanita muscaria (strain Koide BX008) TaxID=946122 RepID=A0A0C2ST35_AMAMK|nr:hypothetical protein M378DRAFT_177841 [Amanita muscaria Koide BX008]